MKPLKIVITVDRYSVGLRYFEYFLAREATARGHSVTVFAFGPRLRGGRTVVDGGFRVVYLPYLFCLTSWLWVPAPGAVLTLVRSLREIQPDVLHCMPLFSPLSVVATALTRRRRTAKVGSLFSGDLFMNHGYDKLRFNLIRIIVKSWVAKRADLVFALSDHLKGLLVEWFALPLSMIRVLPLGTDPREFRPDRALRARTRRALGLSDGDVVLVYSGKFIPDKGLDLLLRAVARLPGSAPIAKVLMVGSGSQAYQRHLERLSRELGLEGRVIFHRFVPREELAALYNAADVAVWPGTHSISMVDAVSAGLPLVMTPKFPAARSLIKDGNGLWFKGGDLDGLAAAVSSLVGDRGFRLEMGSRSRALAERELGWAAIASRYLDAYAAVLGPGSPRHVPEPDRTIALSTVAE